MELENTKKFNGRNQLFINNGDLTFTDQTEEYGLAFQGFSTQASFFDYDNDGDLDMYLVNHSVHTRQILRTFYASTIKVILLQVINCIRMSLFPSGKKVF